MHIIVDHNIADRRMRIRGVRVREGEEGWKQWIFWGPNRLAVSHPARPCQMWNPLGSFISIWNQQDSITHASPIMVVQKSAIVKYPVSRTLDTTSWITNERNHALITRGQTLYILQHCWINWFNHSQSRRYWGLRTTHHQIFRSRTNQYISEYANSISTYWLRARDWRPNFAARTASRADSVWSWWALRSIESTEPSSGRYRIRHGPTSPFRSHVVIVTWAAAGEIICVRL